MEGKMSQQLQILIALLCIGAAFACRGGTIIHSGVTAQEKAIILEAHNKLRATVAMGRVPGQPGAENMMEVVWDDELAKHAQRWANECTFKHDPQRTIDRFIMGQNMAIIWSTAELAEDDGDFPSRVQNWFNEVKKYAFGDSWSPKTGHYSQLVWGETNLVGCGFSYYKTASKYNKLYVCNYGPGGNVVGSNPYEVGSPACTSYGMKPSSHYQGLCSAKVSGSHHNQVVNTFTYKSESYNTKNTYSAQHQNANQQPQQQQLQKAQKQNPLKNYNLSPVSEDQKLRFQQQFHSTFRQQQQQQQQQQQLLQQQQQQQQKLLQQQTQQQQPQQQTVTKHLSASHFAYDWDARFQNNFRR